MILPKFTLTEAESVSDACHALESNEKAKIIAGGTDLLVNMKRKVLRPETLVTLSKVAELKEISSPDAASLALGSMVPIAEIAESPIIKANFPALAQAAGKLGSMQIRSRATIGGNVCTARPAGDTIGPLFAYGATATIASSAGTRTEPIETIFKGPGLTTIRSNEILTSIGLKKPAPRTGGSYIKYTIRNAMEIALVSVTTLVSLEGGKCQSARVVLGAVAPTFIRCMASERFLVGKEVTEEVAERAGQLVDEVCSPITDIRASADYRRTLVRVLVKRSLIEAASSVRN